MVAGGMMHGGRQDEACSAGQDAPICSMLHPAAVYSTHLEYTAPRPTSCSATRSIVLICGQPRWQVQGCTQHLIWLISAAAVRRA